MHCYRQIAPLVTALALVVAIPVADAGQDNKVLRGQALLAALRNADEPLAVTLIDRRTDVNSRDETGATPLIWAAQRRSADLVARLLKSGANPNVFCDTGLGPLQVAIGNDASAIAMLLLDKGAKANVAREDGETALMTAARTAQIDVMRRLIANGADVNAHEAHFNQTALMWSAGHPAQVKLLIERGADVRARTKMWQVTNTIYTPMEAANGPWDYDGEYVTKKGGQSALFFAVQKDDYESVIALLDAGADVNESSADGSTALLLALHKWGDGHGRALDTGQFDGDPPFKPNLKIANLLLDRGARVNVTNTEGYTPLHGAVLSLVPPARLVRDSGGDLSRTTSAELPVDSKDDGMALVKRLLDLKADPGALTRYPTPGPIGAVHLDRISPGSSPLDIAAMSGNSTLVGALLARGGNPNLLRNDGHSPLSIAVKLNDLAVVELLATHGADVTRSLNPSDMLPEAANLEKGQGCTQSGTRSNQTILHIAGASGAYSVVEFLAEHGADLNVKNDRGETALVLAEVREQCRFAAAKHTAEAVALTTGEDVKQVVRETKTSDAIRKAMNSRISSSAPAQSARAF